MGIFFIPLKSSRSKLDVAIVGMPRANKIMERLMKALPKPDRAKLSMAAYSLQIWTNDIEYIEKVAEIVLEREGQFSTHAVWATIDRYRGDERVYLLFEDGRSWDLSRLPEVPGRWNIQPGYRLVTYNSEEIERIKKIVLEYIMNDDIDGIAFRVVREYFYEVIKEG